MKEYSRRAILWGIYVTATERRVVVLHVFAKKSRKTPRRALVTARERMRQVMP
ncbi:MAG: type II toxin-antitoxin system RelE/ParE family toxin [Deltaproteobacteria bacterium]|nr:type II toxin-antitoxin system RelE/ParE family toxin [Deltaproteobacteria bacterium]